MRVICLAKSIVCVLVVAGGVGVSDVRASAKPPEGSIADVIRRRLAEGQKPNRLIHEKSPYLLQHAFNPVDWYPWGKEAFEKARKENKLIFLSVGYSTCYWCHVMEREVFENPEIARLMNDYVVSVKVDREERPDVDRVYMTALRAMTGGGGWPMSMFLTPDLQPFWGATTLPAAGRDGRPGFAEILTQIHGVWTDDPQQALQASRRMGDFLKQVAVPQTKAAGADRTVLKRGFDAFVQSYDPKYGGVGAAPKFPRPVVFNFLFRYFSSAGEARARDMALETLRQMANGGVHDRVGGGFHRYATDARWRVPHFEKMLYDQALLAVSYLEAYQITHEGFYADVARDILAYVQRDMTDPEGGFYSAEDAESAPDPARPDDRREGAFYTWKKEEIDRVLTPRAAGVFEDYYGVEANAAPDAQETPAGRNILYVAHPLEETARRFGLPASVVTEVLAGARERLFLARGPRPHLDDKVLASWNGLMISAFARAHEVLGDQRYLSAGERAAEFLLTRLYRPDEGRFLRRYRDGEARYEANLEDYAFLIQGLLDLYEASLNVRWLKTAIALSDRQNGLFYDREQGGFYDTSGAGGPVLPRTKVSYDDAEPAGNAVAILNLLRLSEMIDSRAYRAMAERSLACFGGRMAVAPQGMAQFLVALDFSLARPKQVVIAGAAEDPRTKELLKEVHARFIPNKIVLLADGGEGQKTLAAYIPFLQNLRAIDGKPTAYICEDYACQLPTSDPATVAQLLAGRASLNTSHSRPGAKP